MKIKNVLTALICSILIIFFLQKKTFSQAPAIEWQRDIGGSSTDYLNALWPTSDGGYIMGSRSFSGISGDKTSNTFGEGDVWAIKVDASGNIEWQRNYGGTGADACSAVLQTSDGGYIFGCVSTSGISGNKTTANIGGYDIWIIKTNHVGNIEWQRSYGGILGEYLQNMLQTPDGGFIISSYSFSGISGNKTEAVMGSNDFWILKLNSTGDIEWQNTIGGSEIDNFPHIELTSDGGYILGGHSNSPVSGDKTEAFLGSTDFWILKLDASGNIVWQNTIGGSGYDSFEFVTPISDGGFIVGGGSSSDISFDKTENHFGAYAVNDYWILKLDNLGNILWQNTIGGLGGDVPEGAIELDDHNLIIAGFSSSNISGDKTENNFGEDSDFWIVKLNAAGTIIWDKTIGGNSNDLAYHIFDYADGGVLIGGNSSSDISGNKTVALKGLTDCWIVKLFPDCIAATETCNSLDDNCNGIIDDGITETISITAGGATTFCQGGSTLLTASFSGVSVQWKKNGTDIAGATSSTYSVNKSGNYSAVTTSPCGTATSSTISVTVNKNPNASISAGGPTSFCDGGSVTLTEIAVAGCTYQWYKGASSIAGATSTNYIATTAGNYKCRVTKTATGCYKNSNAISVTVPCKAGEELIGENNNSSFSINPNPNNGNFEITVPDSYRDLASVMSPPYGGGRGVSIEIYNSLGELMFMETISVDNNRIEKQINSELPAGIYFIFLKDQSTTFSNKFIIE